MKLLVCLALILVTVQPALAGDAPSTRDLSDINWMELKDIVPSKINTVILPTGTLEPHGVINNGADLTAPVAIAKLIAPGVNAMVAPIIPYGMTGAMDAYAARSRSPKRPIAPMCTTCWRGSRKTVQEPCHHERHGGPQTAVLNAVAADVGREAHVRTLVVNWWSYCSDVTLEVFKQDGGSRGLERDRLRAGRRPEVGAQGEILRRSATPNPAPGTYSAYPAPRRSAVQGRRGVSQIRPGQADDYFKKVCAKVEKLVIDTRAKWDKAGL
jgi:creatinine amidohydrolase